MALVLGAFLLLCSNPFAQAATGEAELQLLELFLTSSYGLAIGLGVAIYGIFKFSQNDTAGGLVLVIVGACITFAPGILNGVRLFVCPITAALGVNISC
ncbi:MAG: hypothetical protein INF43_02895 [Alphaproteobacteria bacterium]|nr:hypothetical protein [Alphaproteobacteria bacterium]